MTTESRNKLTIKQLIRIAFWLAVSAGAIILLTAKVYFLFQLWLK